MPSNATALPLRTDEYTIDSPSARTLILDKKYGFDEFNDWFFAGGLRRLGSALWQFGDVRLIDGVLVNGSANLVARFAGVIRHLQSGYIYHYAFTMIIGVLVLVTLLIMG